MAASVDLEDSNPIAESKSLIERIHRKVVGKARATRGASTVEISSRGLRDRIEQERGDVQ